MDDTSSPKSMPWQPRILIPSAVALIAIWTAVFAVRGYTDEYVSTPEKVIALINAAPWRTGNPQADRSTRQAHLDLVAESAAKLTFAQRTRLREEHQEDIAFFYMELTEPERQWMAQKTVEPFYQTVLKAFNAMTKEDRLRIITNTRQQMKRDGRDIGGLERIVKDDPDFWDRMAEEGIATTYEKATPEQRLMMGPLMEELQRRVQGLRR